MKVLLTFIMCVAICNCLNAQIYFESLNGEIPSGEGISESIRVEEGYLSWGFSFGIYKPHLLLTDFDGQLLTELFIDLPDSLRYFGGDVIEVNDSILIGMALREDLSQPSDERGDFCLLQFDKSGDVISEWVYGENDHKDIPQNLISTSDGGYLFSGQTQFEAPPDTDGQLYAVKIDSLGNEQWSQEYGGTLYESGGGGVQTPDGGFLILGWTRSFGAGNRDFYLVKTDNLGSEQWFETYGDSFFDSGQDIGALNDGNYILAGYRNLNDKRQAYFYKVDENGDVIWEQDYGEVQSIEEFRGVIELDNGDLVGVGLFDENAPSGSNNQGLLIRVDSEGNQKWLRTYDKSPQIDLFYSVLETEDGGFLLSGQAINEQTNSQDAWLLKVDSVGCPYPNCTVGIDEEEKTVVVDVWPNPATDVLNIEKVGSSKQLEISVFVLNGREILTSPSPSLLGGERMQLDVSGWSAGVYVLQGTDEEGRSFSLKVVKQ